MSDVRALLKAKRQEVRVKHPYAAYTERGALRCTVCGTGVKHAEAWEGHIGSKAHRMAVMRLKEEEKRRQEEAARVEEERKRKAEEEEEEEEEGGREAKRQRTEEREEGAGVGAANGFPVDFFSDASRAPPPWEEEEEGGEAAAAPPPQKSVIDEEWEAFQRTVLNAPNEAEYEAKEAYERATVFAEPQMVDVTAGMPPAEGQEAEVKDEKLSAEEERKRKQLEDRELIMDRLLEEERVQEEADSRVTLLKARLDTLKKQRELAKAKKTART
ncbi:hypothetical protein EWM64_g8032 [Hericium alpestre]|uniref:Uncharacterized protein n=1 Tax=Hericium alpestre TaxID=135208 RepID=A0A4Y9ZNZ2_9AGAM|nr:hypothetical protein EWM64_g8032 [Hericium alpestre]